VQARAVGQQAGFFDALQGFLVPALAQGCDRALRESVEDRVEPCARVFARRIRLQHRQVAFGRVAARWRDQLSAR